MEDKPIYAGDYIGTWEDLGPPGPAKTIMSMRITPDYKGEMFYASNKFMPFGTGSQDAVITMTVNGATIASFVLNQAVGGYKGGCIATQTLTGRFVDDVNLVLDNFNWPDCDGTRDVALQFFKQ